MTHDRTTARQQASEIIQAWLSGTKPDAAAALAATPALAADKALSLDLAFAEFLIREGHGEQIDVETFCGRFPDYHVSLGRMLAQQSMREPAQADDPAPDDIVGNTMTVDVVPIRGESPSVATPAASAGHGPSASLPASIGMPASGSSSAVKDGNRVWPEPGHKVGDFNLLRQMGKGAFARVFLAVEETVNRHVVVKLSKQKCDEAKVLGQLGHKNVVAVLSAPRDAETGLYIVVMPFHGSATLEDLIELAYPLVKASRERPKRAAVILSAARRNHQATDPSPTDIHPEPFLQKAGFVDGIVWTGVRLADALAAVHRSGFVHHDLKPSNVLLGLDGQPKLLDFNLASDAKDTKSRLGGTLPYMPPEHLKAIQHPDATAAAMDKRGDIFSLGVILYELLTGTHPFGRFPKSRSVRVVAGEMLARQKMGVKPARERNPDVSPRLSRLVERCLSFDPAGRPATAEDVAIEMRRCYSPAKKMMAFAGSRTGRATVMASAIGLVSGVSWMASANARSAIAVEVDYREVGTKAYREGRYIDAVLNLGKVAEANPQDADVWLTLGRARLAQGEWALARPELEQAAELRPTHGPTLATYGWSLAKLGRYEESEAVLDRAIQAGYDTAAVHAVRAYSFLLQRKDQKALEAFTLALARDPANRATIVNRTYIPMKKAISSKTIIPAEVFADLDRAIAAGPDEGYLYLWAARVSASASQLNPGEKGPQTERCRLMLQKAVELGVPAVQYRTDPTFQSVLGDPAVYAKNWRTPSAEADFTFWRLGDPRKEFVD